MAKSFAKLQKIDNDRQITQEKDDQFLYRLQTSLLLALKEQGRLNEMQYRHAEERLNMQRCDRARVQMRKNAERP